MQRAGCDKVNRTMDVAWRRARSVSGPLTGEKGRSRRWKNAPKLGPGTQTGPLPRKHSMLRRHEIPWRVRLASRFFLSCHGAQHQSMNRMPGPDSLEGPWESEAARAAFISSESRLPSPDTPIPYLDTPHLTHGSAMMLTRII